MDFQAMQKSCECDAHKWHSHITSCHKGTNERISRVLKEKEARFMHSWRKRRSPNSLQLS